MARAERLELIRSIEEARGTKVISYVTSTRPNMEVQMAMDCVRRVYEHLRAIDTPQDETNIDLFLHSNGGDGTVPWKLVTLIREYAHRFSVIVPHRAFSAATLTALGADEVVMHPMGMLGPTDPTVQNAFNPQDPANPAQRIGISVEDVSAYISLIKEDTGIRHEDELVQAFNKLADQVHPLALGNVKRSLSQSRMMARKLLALHMDLNREAHRIEEIVDNLTSKLFFHGHPINRREAVDQVGLATVTNPTPELEDLIWRLYLEYETEMQLDAPFLMAQEFTAQHPNLQPGHSAVTGRRTAKLAYVESTARTDVQQLQYHTAGQVAPNFITHVSLIVDSQGWVVEN